jgi:putative spermidine/putrescine transport system permease protein
MSSSSGPDRSPTTPHLDVAEIEQVEEIVEGAPGAGEAALGAATGAREKGKGWITAAWAAPGALWLLFFLVAPLVMIILVSFWQTGITGFNRGVWTVDAYRTLYHSSTYWDQLKQTFFLSLIVTGTCLVLGFPVAYFLSFKVKTLRNQIALFIITLAPFWTSYLIRVTAWVYPVMGREGVINQLFGANVNPFSKYSVALAMVQLYILLMISPIFFLLAQVDRHALEAARDLGASWWKSFREVIIPQTMPGIVIGSIFVFVLSMGDYGTFRVVGAGQVSSVSLIVQNNVNTLQYPLAAASAVVLVIVMMIGVTVLLRFSNLREEL